MVVSVVGVVLLVGGSLLLSHQGGSSTPASATVAESDGVAVSATAPVETRESAAVAGSPIAREARSPQAAPVAKPVAVGASSAAAQQLIRNLSQFRIEGGKMTAEQAQAVRQSLQQIAARGAAAVPAIAEYLLQKRDLAFGEDASKLAGVPTLRAGLIDALGQIGGPQATDVSLQVLQNPENPLEVALASRNLEASASGQYTQQELDVASQTLAQAAAGKSQIADPAPLFQVLQAYGSTSTAADLVKLAPTWNYYATMALAGLPNGQGIPSLIDLAQSQMPSDPNQYNKLPLQMLAQLSPQFPAADDALLNMARQNQIPDSAWLAVAAGLGGAQYQFTRQLPQDTIPPGSGVESGTTTVGGVNETFYSTTLNAGGSVGNSTQRLALIDQLLGVTSNPAAVAALQSARAGISAPNPH